MSGVRSLLVYKGSRHLHEVRLTRFNEETKVWDPIDITTMDFVAKMVKSQTNQEELAQWTVTKTDPEEGILRCELTSEETAELPLGTFYHFLFDSTNDIRVISGQVTVRG